MAMRDRDVSNFDLIVLCAFFYNYICLYLKLVFLQEYEDLDEYETEYEDEEDQEGGEEEYEEEEVHQPTEQELEYLELRQKLKESIRKKMKRDPGSSLANSREKKNALPYSKLVFYFSL